MTKDSLNIAIIPARGGSKRVPRKNIREFLGHPLISYSIAAARSCPNLHKVIVSTDDAEIAAISEKYGASVSMRPAELASDKASTFDTLKYHYNQLIKEQDVAQLVVLQPTSPLRTQQLLSSGLKLMEENPKAASLVAVYPIRLFSGRIRSGYWVADYPEDTRSQDIEPFYVPTGSLYIYRCKDTLEKNTALGAHTLPLVEPQDRMVNIDEEYDFRILEQVYNRYKNDYDYMFQKLHPS